MRAMLVVTSVAAVVCSSFAAQAATRHHRVHGAFYSAYGAAAPSHGFGNGGFLTGPYRQGAPGDNLDIWRRGYYQGNDPDQNIRVQIMRDPRNYTH
jgi:hypothetical protein